MILIVDDDPVIRLLVEEYLTALGHTVQSTETGAACLDILTRAQPQLCIIDMQLPDMTGIELLRAIRSMPAVASTPVLVLSANSDAGELLAAERLRYQGIVPKPFEPRQLAAAVERQLKAST